MVYLFADVDESLNSMLGESSRHLGEQPNDHRLLGADPYIARSTSGNGKMKVAVRRTRCRGLSATGLKVEKNLTLKPAVLANRI